MGELCAFGEKRSNSLEIGALRQQSFRILLGLIAVAGWLGLQVGYTAAPMSPYMWLGTLTAMGGAYVGYMLARRSLRLGSIWLISVMTLALSWFVLAFPFSYAHFFFALIPLASVLIMPRADTWLSLVWVSLSLLSIEVLVPRAAIGYANLIAPLGLSLLTYGFAMLLSRDLHTALEWAWEHQVLAQQRTEEARARRAELARAFKALDEAWHRLERMNNDLIHARAEAEQARRMKAEFAAHISHELRTPLNIILGFSRMMFLSPESYGGEPLPPTYRGDMQAIYRCSQHLSNLVDDILDLSRIEAGRMTISPTKLNLRQDVIERTVSIVQSLAEAKGLDLRVEVQDNLPPVHGDPVRLRQVLLNLVNNAIRFTDHGYITVRATSNGETVMVSVVDTGRGMAPEDVEKAFEAFQQIGTPTEQIEGTGLGLAISRSLIRLHGGRIWADSQIGKGTAVHFTLPAAIEKPPAVTEARMVKRWIWAVPDRGEEYCLVVSPDPLALEVLERHLFGGTLPVPKYQMVRIERLEEIRDAVERLHPRAVVVDERIKRDAAEISAKIPYDVPVVVCSIPSEAEVGLSLGAVGYLRKPIEQEALLSTVENLGPQVESLLIVDDDRWMVRLIARILGTAPRPYRLLEAFDGDEALTLIRQMHPDGVLLDILMPGKDGFEVLREMKADPTLADIPVIMISGAGRLGGEQRELSLFTIARKGQFTIEEIAESLRVVLTSMSPDYVGDGSNVPKRPIVSAG